MKAIYAGSFDPVTIGHMDVIKRSALIFDELIVAVAESTDKKPLFSCQERQELIKESLEEGNLLVNKNIKIDGFSGLLIDYAKKQNSKILIRGLRAVSDFEYEFQMSCMNSKLDNDIQTIFLPASDNVQFISSRFVKQIASLKGDVSKIVSKTVAKRLKNC